MALAGKRAQSQCVAAVFIVILQRRSLIQILAALPFAGAMRADAFHVVHQQRLGPCDGGSVEIERSHHPRQFVGRVRATPDKIVKFAT